MSSSSGKFSIFHTSNTYLMVLGFLGTYQTRTAEYGDNRSDKDGLGNRRPVTASSTDGRVMAERAGVRMVAGPHRCV
jgi:hypothetical protein